MSKPDKKSKNQKVTKCGSYGYSIGHFVKRGEKTIINNRGIKPYQSHNFSL